MRLSIGTAATVMAAVIGGANQASAAYTINFTTPQSSVSFQTVSFSSTLADAYDNSENLVASVADNEGSSITGQVDTLSGAGITSVVFSYDGGYTGPAITNLMFGGVSIDFSSVPVGDIIGNFYASDGVTFSNAIVLQCGGGAQLPTSMGTLPIRKQALALSRNPPLGR
jgi:hypothetical protein